MKGLLKKLALIGAITAGSAGLDAKTAEAQYPGYSPGYVTYPVQAEYQVPMRNIVVPAGPPSLQFRTGPGPLGWFTWTRLECVTPAAVVQVPDWARARLVVPQPLCVVQPTCIVPQPAYVMPVPAPCYPAPVCPAPVFFR